MEPCSAGARCANIFRDPMSLGKWPLLGTPHRKTGKFLILAILSASTPTATVVVGSLHSMSGQATCGRSHPMALRANAGSAKLGSEVPETDAGTRCSHLKKQRKLPELSGTLGCFSRCYGFNRRQLNTNRTNYLGTPSAAGIGGPPLGFHAVHSDGVRSLEDAWSPAGKR